MIGGDELVRLLADPGSGLAVTPLIDAEHQVGDSSIDIRLGPDIIVARRATGTTAFDPSDPDRFRAGIKARQQLVRRRLGDPFHLQPGEFVIARSLEFVSLPDDIGAEALGRSSWGRLGLTIATATLVQPGFKGTITLELANVGNTPIVLHVGLAVAQLTFSRLSQTRLSRAALGLSPQEVPSQERSAASAKAGSWRALQKKRASQREDAPSRYEGQLEPAASRLDRDRDLSWVTPMSIRYVVGVVGSRLSGKSTVVSFLVAQRGFRLYRLAQPLRELAIRRGLDPDDRNTLRELGTELRAEYGDDILARCVYARIRADHIDPGRVREPARIAIEGFRDPAELRAWTRMRLFRPMLIDAETPIRAGRCIHGGWSEIDAGVPSPPRRFTRRGRQRARRSIRRRVNPRELRWFERHYEDPPGRRPVAPVLAAAAEAEGLIAIPNESSVPDLQRTVRERLHELEAWSRGLVL